MSLRRPEVQPTPIRREPSDTKPDTASDGDASVHLEDLVVGQLPDFEIDSFTRTEVAIELVGPHIRVAGTMTTGYHRRLSDFINHHMGLLHLRAVTVLRRNGEPTKVMLPDMWASPSEVTLIAQTSLSEASVLAQLTPQEDTLIGETRWTDTTPGSGVGERTEDLVVERATYELVVVTSGHTLTGVVHIAKGAILAGFIESPEPTFIPMTDVRTRSLADRRIIARYPFALVNRRHVVAASQIQPGMMTGRSVL